jgi:hypothetical protein
MREFLTRNSSLQIAFSRDSFRRSASVARSCPSGEPLVFHVPFHVGFIWLRARVRGLKLNGSSHSWFAI